MDFRIPEPCQESWDAMERRPEGRFCQKCRHDVVDLSRMTRKEAERRVRAAKGSLCVQLALDENDAAVFRPAPSRAPHWAGGLVLVAALGCSRPAGPSSAIAAEPCAIEAPMEPVAEVEPPTGIAHEALAVADVPAVDEGPVVPTAEQRALTARKQEQLRPVIRHARGRIAPSHRFSL